MGDDNGPLSSSFEPTEETGVDAILSADVVLTPWLCDSERVNS